MPASVGAMTVAAPVMKLCATNSRRVRGRECSCNSSGSCIPRALGFLLINLRPLPSCLIDQHTGAAEGRRAGRGGYRLYPGDGVARRCGAKISDQAVELARG